MQHYALSKDAENDLREIARYTLKQWGKSTFQTYKKGLSDKFNEIGKQLVVKHKFSQAFPKLCVTKYRYHFIFYLTETLEKPVIIGVIHEQRDIVKRLNQSAELSAV